MHRRALSCAALVNALTLLLPSSIFAQERTFASLLPSTAVAYVEFESADLLLDHPLRTKIKESPEFLKIWRSPDVLKFRGGMKLAEAALGDKIENIARKLTRGGLVVAVDPQHNGAAMIARTESSEWLDAYMERLIKLARDNADSDNDKNGIKEANYRGINAYQSNDVIVAALGEFLIVTSKGELGKAIVDNYLDSPKDCLESKTNFVAAQKTQAELPSEQENDAAHFAWAFADLQGLRDVGFGKKILTQKSDNFGAELVLGGLLETVGDAATITANWTLTPSATTIALTAPHDATSVSEEREFFFGPESTGVALPLLQSPNTLASLSAYRDVSLMWLRAGDLFDTKVNDQLAQAESTLTTLFSGRDFGEEILGAMQPEIRIMVERQEFDGSQPIPALRLPSFALVAQLRNPEVMQKELKRTFQSLIGFLNVVGAMNGQPQLDLGMDASGTQQFYTAQYEREVDRDQATEAPIQFNFSPTLAFVNGTAVLSSTTPLARRLAEQLDSGSGEAATTDLPIVPKLNTLFEVDAAAVQSALADNRQQLIAQNILEKGHSQEEAEGEIDTLLSILSLFEGLKVELGFEQQATLDLTLQLAN